MSKIIKIAIILLLCTIIGVTISNATSNDKLPTEKEVNALLEEAENQKLDASEVMDLVKEKLPNANVDLLEKYGVKAVKVYWKGGDTNDGYGKTCYADYRGGDSKIVSSWVLTGYELQESYKGKLDDLENTTENNNSSQPEEDSTVIKDDETEKNSDHTYKDFTTALDSYTGKTDCTSKSCAQSLSDYFKDKGYSTEVKYCVAVTTSDEGTVYVVLGV